MGFCFATLFETWNMSFASSSSSKREVVLDVRGEAVDLAFTTGLAVGGCNTAGAAGFPGAFDFGFTVLNNPSSSSSSASKRDVTGLLGLELWMLLCEEERVCGVGVEVLPSTGKI